MDTFGHIVFFILHLVSFIMIFFGGGLVLFQTIPLHLIFWAITENTASKKRV